VLFRVTDGLGLDYSAASASEFSSNSRRLNLPTIKQHFYLGDAGTNAIKALASAFVGDGIEPLQDRSKLFMEFHRADRRQRQSCRWLLARRFDRRFGLLRWRRRLMLGDDALDRLLRDLRGLGGLCGLDDFIDRRC
jgi:hypothetical protein